MENKYSEVEIAWFSGLFEGEGSFWFSKDVPKGLQISMTDYDVLERVKDIVGGNLNTASRKRYKPHWKDAWRWSCNRPTSLELIPLMLPLLSERRTKRAIEFVEASEKLAEISTKKSLSLDERKSVILSLKDSGEYTHKQIAEQLGMDRSHVTHIINGRGR